jgi:uncharacterized protein YyaL (SSP411 family)
MAHESFEDPEVARLLNDSFVAIKVDREERPDVDALYMAATQALSGHGGWPMSVFLTPEARPFMAGTYYPPVDRHGQVGFTRLLAAMHDAWINQRPAVEDQARQLSEAAAREVSYIDHLSLEPEGLGLGAVQHLLRDELLERADDDGGFGPAPKFPRPSYLDALILESDPASRLSVERSLEAMSRGGIYDHLRGGFARYSVDAQWHVPHFEKMLSDQALLARCYLRASRARRDHPEWREVALDTLRFVLTDLSVGRGFASSLDADANGVEGSHVTWTPEEVAAALESEGLGDQTSAILKRFRISSPGPFEGRCIPRLSEDQPFVAPDHLRRTLDVLRDARSQRPQPARDEKIILEWNAMFASALLASNDEDFIDVALALLANLTRTHQSEGVWWRTDHRNAFATAGDVGWLLDAHLDAFEATGVDEHLNFARTLAQYLLEHFWDGEVPSEEAPHQGQGLFSQSDLAHDLPIRPKEIFDGATPSAHAVGCRALARLALCTGEQSYLFVAERLLELARPLMSRHPSAVVDLVIAAPYVLNGVEIVIPGDSNELSEHVRSLSMSNAVLITGRGSSPLLDKREVGLAYVCRRGVCQLPARSVAELEQRLLEVGD